MLILTRKVEQAIIIDEHTIVRVLSIDGDRVKIGIDAPAKVAVLREELLQEVAGENRRSARPAGSRKALERFRSLRRINPPQPPPAPRSDSPPPRDVRGG